MPKDFDRCVREHGRVRRLVPKKGTYLNVCWKGGKTHRGELHHKDPTVQGQRPRAERDYNETRKRYKK